MGFASVCPTAGCGRIVPDGRGLCEACRKDTDKKDRQQRFERNPQRRHYFSTRWERVRRFVIERDHGLCQCCKAAGRTKTGNQVDHILPARNRPELFWSLSNLQLLCHRCHAMKTTLEDSGRPALTVVTGPPSSGKTTYVNRHRSDGDLVFDLDSIAGALGPWQRYEDRPRDVADLIRQWREVLVTRVKQRHLGRPVWLIVTDRIMAEGFAQETAGLLIELDNQHRVRTEDYGRTG